MTTGTESKSLIGIKYSYKIENSVNSRSLTSVFLLACLCNSCISLFYSALILDFTDSCLSQSLYIGFFLLLWFKTAVVKAQQLPGLFFYLSHLTHFVILINERPFSSKCFSQISACLETISPKNLQCSGRWTKLTVGQFSVSIADLGLKQDNHLNYALYIV